MLETPAREETMRKERRVRIEKEVQLFFKEEECKNRYHEGWNALITCDEYNDPEESESMYRWGHDLLNEYHRQVEKILVLCSIPRLKEWEDDSPERLRKFFRKFLQPF